MPVFSVVIPSYNNAEYLPKALKSLSSQSFKDWEAIVVVDGSPDNAASVARNLAASDCRIRVFEKLHNEGTHRARKTGVEECTGTYSMFLDADDEFRPEAFQMLYDVLSNQDTDILHFGTELFGENMSKDVCDNVLELCNRDLPTLKGEQIVRSSFTSDDERRQDWRILQRVFKTSLLKRAFSLMSDARLGRGQDSYEWLVIASEAQTEIFRNDIVAYRYFLGRGITTFSPISAEQFQHTAEAYASLIRESEQYASSFHRFDLLQYVQELQVRLNESLIGDWDARVEDNDKISALHLAGKFIARSDIAAELMRIVRDHAYEQWCHPASSKSFDYIYWFDYAEKLAQGLPKTDRYLAFQQTAERHITDIRNREESITNKVTRKKHSALSRMLLRLTRSNQSQ